MHRTLRPLAVMEGTTYQASKGETEKCACEEGEGCRTYFLRVCVTGEQLTHHSRDIQAVWRPIELWTSKLSHDSGPWRWTFCLDFKHSHIIMLGFGITFVKEMFDRGFWMIVSTISIFSVTHLCVSKIILVTKNLKKPSIGNCCLCLWCLKDVRGVRTRHSSEVTLLKMLPDLIT